MILRSGQTGPRKFQSGKVLPARIMLLIILALFILPLLLAWMMYSGSIDFQPDKTRNLGHLVLPIVPIEWSALSLTEEAQPATGSLDGFWVIVYPVPIDCTNRCLERATELRQVLRASGRNQDRIKILVLLESPSTQDLRNELLGIFPAFNLATDPTATFNDALQIAADHSGNKNEALALYLVDPLGNIMMTYNGNDGPARLSKDLARLLTWSKLDKRS